jgi:hypothetical protein
MSIVSSALNRLKSLKFMNRAAAPRPMIAISRLQPRGYSGLFRRLAAYENRYNNLHIKAIIFSDY